MQWRMMWPLTSSCVSRNRLENAKYVKQLGKCVKKLESVKAKLSVAKHTCMMVP
jgi:hypothetical protein